VRKRSLFRPMHVEKHDVAFEVIQDRWLIFCLVFSRGGGYAWLGFVVDLSVPNVDVPPETRTILSELVPPTETSSGWGSTIESAMEMARFWFDFTRDQLLKRGRE
jgi:hypothetical protein